MISQWVNSKPSVRVLDVLGTGFSYFFGTSNANTGAKCTGAMGRNSQGRVKVLHGLMRHKAACLGLAILLWLPVAYAEETGGREHAFVLEFGPAAEWPSNGERSNYGVNVAVEKEVIAGWLEIELGITGLGSNGRRAFSTDLLFKKPFQISPTFEFMIGAGPSIERTVNGPDRRTSKSATLALDFMFWPYKEAHKDIGWFAEPTWSVTPATGEKSFGMTGGLLIGF